MAPHRQAQTGLQQEKDQRGGPGLWGAGDGAERRSFTRPAGKTAQQLGEAMQINEQARIEQTCQDLEH
jgi:hypothetical protein